jgi:uncharacterized protein YdeI (YjbR/CyaY-like superfamily)
MGKKNPAVDAYIAKANDFAKPILTHIRDVVHAAVPDVEEELKWGHPSFIHKGMMCGMAAFKEHCTFGFWKGEQIVTQDGVKIGLGGKGAFNRLTTVSDLPSKKVLAGYVKEAARLNDEGTPGPMSGRPAKPAKAVTVPPYLMAALKKNKKAIATWEDFSPSARNEYVAWLTEAKTEETRAKRLAQAVEWIAEGKQRNWKYMK